MNRPLYQVLAGLVAARMNCAQSGNTEWHDRHEERAESLVSQYLPHGSGFDSGTRLDWDQSTPDRIVFHADFHHMDDGGYYDGWTEHRVIVRASLQFGFELRVTGRDKRDIKAYIADTFHPLLAQEVKAYA